jgi:hypothetical protein
MLIDSDRDRPHKAINATKRRLQNEFNHGPGHAWITEGREIENYLTLSQVQAAISVVHPKATAPKSAGKYDNVLSIRGPGGKFTVASKVEVARHVTSASEPDFSVLDLKRRIQAIRNFIWASNPKIKADKG